VSEADADPPDDAAAEQGHPSEHVLAGDPAPTSEAVVSTNYDMPESTCWAADEDQLCKAFVLQRFASTSELANYEGGLLVRSMDAVFQWLRHGVVPPAATRPRVLKPAPE
jgi:hypothetical protein